MRTPLDAFHQALVNHVETRRRTEEGTVRRRRRIGVGGSVSDGTPVRIHVPQNLLVTQWHLSRFHGKIGTVEVTVYADSAHVRIGDEMVSLPLTYLEHVDPPPDNIEDIERWLNEN